jgi:hypothetical protein
VSSDGGPYGGAHKGADGLTDGGSRSSSWWPSGVGGDDAAWQGEVGALLRWCSFLLGGTPAAVAMKVPQQQHQRVP